MPETACWVKACFWPHCFWVLSLWSVGPVALGLWWGNNTWWELVAEQMHSSHSQETRKRDEGARVSQCSSGESLLWSKGLLIDPTFLQVPPPPTTPGAQTFNTWAFGEYITASWSEKFYKPIPILFFTSCKHLFENGFIKTGTHSGWVGFTWCWTTICRRAQKMPSLFHSVLEME